MATFRDLSEKICRFFLFKFPLIDALSLLMLFAERAQTERNPPVNSKLVYAYLIACIGCGVLLSASLMQKAACLVYSGLMFYFSVNFYINPSWEYPEWQRLMLSVRQFGVLAVFVMLAYIVDQKRSYSLRRIGEICLGLHLMCYVYLMNNIPQYREAFISHFLGGDYMRYLIAITLAGCALSFFSGYFLKDMAVCGAVTLLLTIGFVDLDLSYWISKGVHQWSILRQIFNSACTVVGLLYIFFKTDNRLDKDHKED